MSTTSEQAAASTTSTQLTDAEKKRLATIQAEIYEAELRANAANPEGRYKDDENQLNTQRRAAFEAQREALKQKAQALRNEFETLKAKAPSDLQSTLSEGGRRTKFQSDAIAISEYGGNYTRDDQYHFSSSPTERKTQEGLAQLAAYYPYATNKQILDYFDAKITETELAQKDAERASKFGEYSTPKEQRGFARRPGPPPNVEIDYAGTLAARVAGYNVLGGLTRNLPETFAKDEEKRFGERNKFIGLVENIYTQKPETPKHYLVELSEGKKQSTDYSVSLTEGIQPRQAKSFAVSLTEGMPRQPRQLTQEQVNALNPQEYSVYLSEFEPYNRYITEQNRLQRKEAQTKSKPILADLKAQLKYYKAFGFKEIAITTPTGTRKVPIESAYREILVTGKQGIAATFAPVFREGTPQEQMIKYSQDITGKVSKEYGVPSEGEASILISPLSVKDNILTGLTTVNGKPSLVLIDTTPPPPAPTKFEPLDAFSRRVEQAVYAEKQLIPKSLGVGGLEVYSTAPITLDLLERAYKAQHDLFTGQKLKEVSPYIPRTPGMELASPILTGFVKTVQTGDREEIRVGREKGVEALSQYAEKEGVLPTATGLAAMFIPLPSGSKFRFLKGLVKVETGEKASAKLGKVPTSMLKPKGQALPDLNAAFRETPRIEMGKIETLAQLKKRNLADNLIKSKLEELMGKGASEAAVRFNPTTGKIDVTLAKVKLGKGPVFQPGKGGKSGDVGPPDLPPGSPPTLKVSTLSELEAKPKFTATEASLGVGSFKRRFTLEDAELIAQKRFKKLPTLAEIVSVPFRAKIKLGAGKQILPEVKTSTLKVTKVKPLKQRKFKPTGKTKPEKLGTVSSILRKPKGEAPADLNQLFKETPRIESPGQKTLGQLKEQNIAKNVIRSRIEALAGKGVSRIALRYNPRLDKIDRQLVQVGLGRGDVFIKGSGSKFLSRTVSLGKSEKTQLVTVGGGLVAAPTTLLGSIAKADLPEGNITNPNVSSPIVKVTPVSPPPIISSTTTTKAAAVSPRLKLIEVPKTLVEKEQEPLKLLVPPKQKQKEKQELRVAIPVKETPSFTKTVVGLESARLFRAETSAQTKARLDTKSAVFGLTGSKQANLLKSVQAEQIKPAQRRRFLTTPTATPRTKTVPKQRTLTTPAARPKEDQLVTPKTITVPLEVPKLLIKQPPRPPGFLFPDDDKDKRKRKRGKLHPDDFLGNVSEEEIELGFNRPEITTGIERSAKRLKKDLLFSRKREGYVKFVRQTTGSILSKQKKSILFREKEKEIKRQRKRTGGFF